MRCQIGMRAMGNVQFNPMMEGGKTSKVRLARYMRAKIGKSRRLMRVLLLKLGPD
jgi:hypothetical protein